ncbi:MAG TPA: radical SAM protein [Acidobacteriaceae bacterium]|jgi:MoaA/NifB/PqqE/SkfB family radical SAM enzyme
MSLPLVAEQATVIDQQSTLTSLPILLLHVHESCNCRCVMCDIWKRERGAELDLEILERHKASLQSLNVRQVVLTGGEPLLHTRLPALCAFLRESGAERITLLSTGLLLRKHAEMVAASIDEIYLSLDGPEEVHDRVRRVRSGFQLMREGIQSVRALAPEMPIHARMTIQNQNHVTLRAAVDAAKTLGVDSISFLPADVTSQAFNRELIWPLERQSQVALTPSEVHALEAEIEALIDEYGDDLASGFIVERPEKLRRIARRFREQLGELAPVSPHCNAPWVSAVLEVNGDVRPCFFHPAIGNVREQSLEAALNSPQAQEFRRTLDIESNPICQRCVCSLHYKG